MNTGVPAAPSSRTARMALLRASSSRRLAVMDGGLIGPRRHCRLPPVRKDGSTRGLRLGISPDSHPWADAAHGGPEAR